MSLAAARVGDLTATGDAISGPGVATVLIAGQPAAVVGDMVAGSVFAGSITTGSATVLIGGRPAARMTSVCAGSNVQTGVPMSTTVAAGAPTVLIGG
jgi:uncharacterized Zn-binding protein involved in type VI secretion